MSYCRWSSDNWMCDLYCYKNVSGFWTTHVASSRLITEIPKIPKNADIETWVKTFQAQTKALENAEYKPIDLPYDGETFNDPSLDTFLERLNCLKEVGYNIPNYVFDVVEKQILEVMEVKEVGEE